MALAAVLLAQETDILIKLTSGERPTIAVPDLRGAGEAQAFMTAFNQALFSDLQDSGLFRMAPKSVYPLQIPQRPQDFRPPATASASSGGLWLTDWQGPPVNANYLTLGYAAVQNGQLVLFGWLFDVTRPDVQSAQALGKIYLGTLDEAGARKVAHDFARDILGQFGAKSLAGTRIYFVSDRTGPRRIKEIWSMDFDGANQKQITSYKSISTFPAVSPDATKLGFTTYARGTPSIMVHSLETGRRLPFINPPASVNAASDFTPDSQQLLLYSTFGARHSQIYIANTDGNGLRRISAVQAIEVEPKVNPKNASEIVFVSGRGGLAQIYKMNMDGADIMRLTNGEGEANNPAWHPDGKHIAFAWTRGFAPGNYNIFVMDVASLKTVQLTHGSGRNENPGWAPDGLHIVFSSNRSGSSQIWSMLADGTQLKQLTTQGNNYNPVWSRQ
jgi:TolB protein